MNTHTTPPGGPQPLVEVRELTKRYKNVTGLDSATLSLAPGQIVGLLGPNSCGKTTLLKILAGVLADYSGTALVNGLEPHSPAAKANVAFLPSVQFLHPALTPFKAIDLFARFFADFDAAKARQTMEFFALPLDRPLKQMSKGMAEKVQIALIMARRARLYLLDEPISGVDPAAREVIMQGILRDFSEDALILISTHLLQDVEPIIDTAVFMREGRVVRTGNVDDLRAEHGLSLDALFKKEFRS
ncbi:MAG: ABC transporter ATP-binding protein [Buchananella hordeovulneris]|nr:ABC transporter ATP-binding protein [Buchananella hordeovulneris]